MNDKTVKIFRDPDTVTRFAQLFGVEGCTEIIYAENVSFRTVTAPGSRQTAQVAVNDDCLSLTEIFPEEDRQIVTVALKTTDEILRTRLPMTRNFILDWVEPVELDEFASSITERRLNRMRKAVEALIL